MDKYAGYDFESLKKAGENKKSFTFGNFKQAQGFDNAPEVPGAGNPDTLEMQDTDRTDQGGDIQQELLAALKEITEEHAKLLQTHGKPFGWGQMTVDNARSVISKAEQQLGGGNEVQPFNAEDAALSAKPDPVIGNEFLDDGGPDSPYGQKGMVEPFRR